MPPHVDAAFNEWAEKTKVLTLLDDLVRDLLSARPENPFLFLLIWLLKRYSSYVDDSGTPHGVRRGQSGSGSTFSLASQITRSSGVFDVTDMPTEDGVTAHTCLCLADTMLKASSNHPFWLMEDVSYTAEHVSVHADKLFQSTLFSKAQDLYMNCDIIGREPPKGIDSDEALVAALERMHNRKEELFPEFPNDMETFELDSHFKGSPFLVLLVYFGTSVNVLWCNQTSLAFWGASDVHALQEKWSYYLPVQMMRRNRGLVRAAHMSKSYMHTTMPFLHNDKMSMATVFWFPCWINNKPLAMMVGYEHRYMPSNTEKWQLATFWDNSAAITTVYDMNGIPVVGNFEAMDQLSECGGAPCSTPTVHYTVQIKPDSSYISFLPHVSDRQQVQSILHRVKMGEEVNERVKVYSGDSNIERWHFLRARQVNAIKGQGPSQFLMINEIDATDRIKLEKKLEVTLAQLGGKYEELRLERERADVLMLHILPARIVTRLNSGESFIADQYHDVSLLFADIVGFTNWASKTPARTVVAILNSLISSLDSLAISLQVEKIKTIGDCYFCATGCPNPQQDHAPRLLDFALRMLDEVSSISTQKMTIAEMSAAYRSTSYRSIQQPPEIITSYPAGPNLTVPTAPLSSSGSNQSFEATPKEWPSEWTMAMRVGMHTGSVVGGIIGKDKYTFDLWGDTVNTASRMESTGVPGKIQVSSEMYELLKGDKRVKFESREVAAKGKGILNTYIVSPLESDAIP